MAMPTNMPTRPIKRPSDLLNVTNGKVPSSLMVPIGKRGSLMHHMAFRGWQCLMFHLVPQLARLGADGWDLASIDPRTYERQWQIYDRRTYPASGRYLPESMWAAHEARGGRWGTRDNGSIEEDLWQAPNSERVERWRRVAGYAMAAIPGTSPHGLALAVDLALDDDDDAIADPITEAVVRFLMADNLALNCGFAWSTPSEPWHVQWYVGDDIPQFVLDWEKLMNEHPPIPPTDPIPTNPLPTSGLELIGMYTVAVRYGPGTAKYRITAKEVIHEVNGDAANIDKSAGVNEIEIGWEGLVALLASRRSVGNPFRINGAPRQDGWFDANLDAHWEAARNNPA
jgi:hypothetical protein